MRFLILSVVFYARLLLAMGPAARTALLVLSTEDGIGVGLADHRHLAVSADERVFALTHTTILQI
jgi:hypothetical protein